MGGSMEKSIWDDLNDQIAQDIAKLPDVTTYCSRLAHEILKESSEHFRFLGSNCCVEGVEVRYHCNLDDRIYTVKITASHP